MKINLEKLKEEQKKLSKEVKLKEDFDKINFIAGNCCLYTFDRIIAGIVVCDFKTMKVVDRAYVVGKVEFPYIPGFLAYREAPFIIKAYEKLKQKPDLMLVAGNGVLHPRKFGLASHLGIALDLATIGVAKALLCGTVREDSIYLDKDVVGKLLKTKEFSKPIYVSVGHKISLSKALEIVKKCLKGHKLPEPLHLTHKFCVKIRNKIKQEIKKDGQGGV